MIYIDRCYEVINGNNSNIIEKWCVHGDDFDGVNDVTQ